MKGESAVKCEFGAGYGPLLQKGSARGRGPFPGQREGRATCKKRIVLIFAERSRHVIENTRPSLGKARTKPECD